MSTIQTASVRPAPPISTPADDGRRAIWPTNATATNEPLLQAGEPSIGWCLMAAAILLLYGAGLAWVLYGFVNVIRVVWTSFAN